LSLKQHIAKRLPGITTMIKNTFTTSPLAKAVAIGLATFIPLQALAQESEEESVERIEVTGSLGSLLQATEIQLQLANY